MIRFDIALVQAVAVKDVNTVEDVLDYTPYFCLSPHIRAILWEEAHNPVRKTERNLTFKRTRCATTRVARLEEAAEPINSDFLDELCEETVESIEKNKTLVSSLNSMDMDYVHPHINVGEMVMTIPMLAKQATLPMESSAVDSPMIPTNEIKFSRELSGGQGQFKSAMVENRRVMNNFGSAVGYTETNKAFARLGSNTGNNNGIMAEGEMIIKEESSISSISPKLLNTNSSNDMKSMKSVDY